MIKPSPKSEADVIAEKMMKSLESTCNGLSMFSESLQNSGLGSSFSAYQQMMSVLVQQKKWSDSHSRKEMQQIWNDIAKHAENLYGIMKPYSEIMDVLRSINKDSTQVKPTVKENKILHYMKKYPTISVSELSENLKMKKKDIIAELVPFVKKGSVEKKGRGKTLCYRLLE